MSAQRPSFSLPEAPTKSCYAFAVSAPPLEKLEVLRKLLREMNSALVCFSGGIDSAFVLSIATEQLGTRAVGMTAVSPSLPQREHEAARRIAEELGARHELVLSGELSRPGYVQNGPDRCFHCKSELYAIAHQKQKEWELSWILNGTNTDDQGDYRPGLIAAKEAGARSPLVEAALSKADVRNLARHVGLRIWDKPAAACLSSRIPYGTSVTRERLARVEALETALQDLGFRRVRVRFHETVARIEVPPEELPRLVEPKTAQQVTAAGREAGFQFVTADLLGYRSGSLNEMLQGRSLRVMQS